MASASLTGLIKMLLIIIGAFVLLRFIGQLANAKRNMEEERQLNASEKKRRQEQEKVQKNFGKTNILSKDSSSGQVEDVDYEDVEE